MNYDHERLGNSIEDLKIFMLLTSRRGSVNLKVLKELAKEVVEAIDIVLSEEK